MILGRIGFWRVLGPVGSICALWAEKPPLFHSKYFFSLSNGRGFDWRFNDVVASNPRRGVLPSSINIQSLFFFWLLLFSLHIPSFPPPSPPLSSSPLLLLLVLLISCLMVAILTCCSQSFPPTAPLPFFYSWKMIAESLPSSPVPSLNIPHGSPLKCDFASLGIYRPFIISIIIASLCFVNDHDKQKLPLSDRIPAPLANSQHLS